MKRPKKSWSIKTKLIVIITSFTGLALLLLVLTQVFFLDFFYQHIKIHSIETATAEICGAVGTEDLSDYMEYWHTKEQLEILLVDESGNVLFREMSDRMENSRFDRASLQAVFEETKKSGTYFLQDSVVLSPPNKPLTDVKPDEKPEQFPEDRPPAPMSNRSNMSEQLVYARIAGPTDTDHEYMVLIYASISPVSATVRTLVFQFSIAICVLVGMSFVISRLIAKKIADPIIKINTAAKDLAKGTYETPQAGGYREIDELLKTLDQASKDLKRSEELQRELFANVSHDLRTPLTMITGYSEAIRDLPGEDSADNIQVVIDEANRLTRLVDDVLDLSKIRTGSQPLNLQTFDPNEVVGEIAERCRRMAEPDGFTLQYEGEEGLCVEADELRLSQAVYNLIGNAMMHSKENKEIHVTLTREGDYARVSVIDHGPGIPERELEDIWKRYYRLNTPMGTSGLRSTGLGLSIVRAVAERHNGRCGVSSEQGKGSCFWFELPCFKA